MRERRPSNTSNTPETFRGKIGPQVPPEKKSSKIKHPHLRLVEGILLASAIMLVKDKKGTWSKIKNKVEEDKQKVRTDPKLTDDEKAQKLEIIEGESSRVLIQAEQEEFGTEGDS